MMDIRESRCCESGQGMVEYGLIIGLISILVIAVFVTLGGPLMDMFQNTFDDETLGKNQAALSAGIY